MGKVLISLVHSEIQKPKTFWGVQMKYNILKLLYQTIASSIFILRKQRHLI